MGRHGGRHVRRAADGGVKANLPQTYFAWSGPTTNGSAAYFRIQGPTLVIEYAPQGGVDHIHTIYRDPTNDYGAKLRASRAALRSWRSPLAMAGAGRSQRIGATSICRPRASPSSRTASASSSRGRPALTWPTP